MSVTRNLNLPLDIAGKDFFQDLVRLREEILAPLVLQRSCRECSEPTTGAWVLNVVAFSFLFWIPVPLTVVISAMLISTGISSTKPAVLGLLRSDPSLLRVLVQLILLFLSQRLQQSRLLVLCLLDIFRVLHLHLREAVDHLLVRLAVLIVKHCHPIYHFYFYIWNYLAN